MHVTDKKKRYQQTHPLDIFIRFNFFITILWGKAGSGPNHREAKEGGLKTFLNLKRFFAFILFYYLHNYFKYISIILFTKHRVVCNDILGGTTLR